MKNALIILLLFVFNLNVYSQFENIESFQRNLIENEVTASNVALVFKNDKVIYHHIENSLKTNDKPINNNTIFPIWSMSKPITIAAIMMLYEKGVIDIEDKVSKYIPEFENIKCKNENGSYDCKNELTLLHLLTHRSGYGYYANPEFFTSSIKYDNLKDFVSDVANHTLEFEPGTKYLYGINMAILGRIVEVVTNQSFYDFLKNEIFIPLDMNETKFHLTESDRKRFQPLYINNGSIKGFTNDLDELTYDINNKAHFGGEGLTSTMDDYSNFCQMLVNGGTYKGQKIISQESIDMMTKPSSTVEGDPFDYGFSLFVLRDPKLDGTNSSKGIFGWSGYHNTHFWIDQEKNLFGLFMTRARDFSFEIQKEFRRTTYNSLSSKN